VSVPTTRSPVRQPRNLLNREVRSNWGKRFFADKRIVILTQQRHRTGEVRNEVATPNNVVGLGRDRMDPEAHRWTHDRIRVK